MAHQPPFIDALLAPAAPRPEGLLDGSGRAAGRRFDVYRNNVAVSLSDAVKTGFPVITRILGEQTMTALAGAFLRSHPPQSPLMMHYGAQMPAFLDAAPQVAHLGYLPDIARLELALRRSYHARDVQTVTAEELAALGDDGVNSTKFTLAPSCEVICSDWPIYDIWRFNMDPDAPKPVMQPQDIVITRAEFDPEPNLLPDHGAAFLTTLRAGATLPEALDTVPEGFDATQTLTVLLTGSALVYPQKKD